jgi:hypothetical protein
MLCPDYLAMAPLDVQETMEGLHAAPATIQARTLLFTFSTAVMTNPGKNKRLQESEGEHFGKRARPNPSTTQSNKSRGIFRKSTLSAVGKRFAGHAIVSALGRRSRTSLCPICQM